MYWSVRLKALVGLVTVLIYLFQAQLAQPEHQGALFGTLLVVGSWSTVPLVHWSTVAGEGGLEDRWAS